MQRSRRSVPTGNLIMNDCGFNDPISLQGKIDSWKNLIERYLSVRLPLKV